MHMARLAEEASTHCEESPRDFREEIIMTRHGKPIGRLVPTPPESTSCKRAPRWAAFEREPAV